MSNKKYKSRSLYFETSLISTQYSSHYHYVHLSVEMMSNGNVNPVLRFIKYYFKGCIDYFEFFNSTMKLFLSDEQICKYLSIPRKIK